MKPEEVIKVLENYIMNLIEYAEVSEDSIAVQTYRAAIQALEKSSQLEDVKSIVDNTYRCQDDVYYMSDAEAMEILRDYFESGGRK